MNRALSRKTIFRSLVAAFYKKAVFQDWPGLRFGFFLLTPLRLFSFYTQSFDNFKFLLSLLLLVRFAKCVSNSSVPSTFDVDRANLQ